MGAVTVIIPAFNYGRFLSKAIDSALTQTYESIECIVVDSGSTDETPDILNRYEGQVKVITLENRGPSVARNAGIISANGEYIAFLDADDWWEPKKIEVQMQYFTEFPSISAVGCGERQVSLDNCVIGTIIPKQFTENLVDNLRAVAIRRLLVAGSTSGVMIRKDVFDNIGMFDESLIGAEDWDM
ncbi:MAG: glycosyltransferase family A protein [Proteobacteria bacterium]|nr:glycosyltransferase family A protein [Pseudomonadota bacterium]